MNQIIAWVLKISGLMIAALGSFIVVKKHKMKPDNFIEEHIEKKIEEETGLIIDLSPDTQDPDDDKPSKTKL